MIRQSFTDCTVLTIAHRHVWLRPSQSSCARLTGVCVICRLETIMDSDRIIVMDQGVVVEFDSPLALLDRGAGGVLYELCEATGNMAQLRDIASGHATL